MCWFKQDWIWNPLIRRPSIIVKSVFYVVVKMWTKDLDLFVTVHPVVFFRGGYFLSLMPGTLQDFSFFQFFDKRKIKQFLQKLTKLIELSRTDSSQIFTIFWSKMTNLVDGQFIAQLVVFFWLMSSHAVQLICHGFTSYNKHKGCLG